MAPVTISNRLRFVNRFEYYLGNGSKRANAELFHWTDGIDRDLKPFLERLKNAPLILMISFP